MDVHFEVFSAVFVLHCGLMDVLGLFLVLGKGKMMPKSDESPRI